MRIAIAVALSASLWTGCGPYYSAAERAEMIALIVSRSFPTMGALAIEGANSTRTTIFRTSGGITLSGEVVERTTAKTDLRLQIGMRSVYNGHVTVGGHVGETDVSIDTAEEFQDRPQFHLSLQAPPDGAFSGTITGTFSMKGDTTGSAVLDLVVTGELEPMDGDAYRMVGDSIQLKGTSTSDGVGFAVDHRPCSLAGAYCAG